MNLTPFIEPLPSFLRRPVLHREALWRDSAGTTVIPHPSVGMLYARRGGGKTLTALDLGLRVASSSSWGPYTQCTPTVMELPDGTSYTPPRRVLFVDGEMPEADLQVRLRSMLSASPDLARGAESSYLLGSDRLAAQSRELNLGRSATRRSLTSVVEDFSIDFLVLDNWVSLMQDVDENDNTSVGPIARWLARLRHDGISVLLVHHAGKEGEQRGASAREDVLDYSIRLTQRGRPGGDATWRLAWDKVRGGMPQPSYFDLTYDGSLVTFRRSREEALISALTEAPRTASDLEPVLGLSRAAVGRLLREQEEAGIVTSEEGPRREHGGRPARLWRLRSEEE